MRKLFYALLAVTIFAFKVNAQSVKLNLEHAISPGTITTTDDQTIKGYIENQGSRDNQKQCLFYTDYNDRRTRKVYKPSELKGYTIENYQYKSLNYSGNISFIKSSNRNFLYVVKPGAITTCVYLIERDEQPVWQKGDEEPVSNASMLFSFKKNVLKLVGDYPELAAKIENKEKGYGLLNLQAIIDEYNAWYAAKNASKN